MARCKREAIAGVEDEVTVEEMGEDDCGEDADGDDCDVISDDELKLKIELEFSLVAVDLELSEARG